MKGLEGMPEQPILPGKPVRESMEGLPIYEYTFCNNHNKIQTILAPDGEIARDRFYEKEGRLFGSNVGDSVSRVQIEDVLPAE